MKVKDQIQVKIEEMRQKFPHMFSHLEARHDEIWVGDQLAELADQTLDIYRQQRIKIRCGRMFFKKTELRIKPNPKEMHKKKKKWVMVAHVPVFVRAEDLAALSVLYDIMQAHRDK